MIRGQRWGPAYTGLVSSVGGRLGGSGEGRALVKPLSRETDIRKGDLVITSGLSEIYPKGLTVGVIEQTLEGQYGLTLQGTQASRRFRARRWVAVLSQ